MITTVPGASRGLTPIGGCVFILDAATLAAMSQQQFGGPTPMRSTPDPAAARYEGYEPPGMVIIFAATILFLSGGFNLLFGLAAVLNDAVVSSGGNGGVAIADFGFWGWVMMAAGVAMMLTGIGLGLGVGAARWLAIVFVTLNAIAQFAIASAFPILAIMVILLDVVVLYQLTARWHR